MDGLITVIVVVGGLAAAGAVGLACVLGFAVWLAGGRTRDDTTEAWPPRRGR